jgi:WD40 repeat protein
MGAYRLGRKLGEGGHASVYVATHEELGTRRALKFVRRASPEALERFQREARVHATLDHPHVARVHDLFERHDTFVLVMELVDGPTLDAWRADHPSDLDAALSLLAQVCDAVAHAHSRGVIHRDLKPQNVLVGPGPHAFVTDFGVAKALDDSFETYEDALTHTGSVLGTPAYMAPEQLRKASHVDARADVFSLGVILYELCCGRRPFAEPNVFALAESIRAGVYTPAREVAPGLDPRLDALIASCLAQDPELRPAGAAELRDALRALTGDASPRAQDAVASVDPPGRAVLWWAALAACVGLALAAAWFARDRAELAREAGASAVDAKAKARRASAVALEARLRALATTREATAPAEALALWRAAQDTWSGLGDAATPAPMDHRTLARLMPHGAGAWVLPVGSQVLSTAFRASDASVYAGTIDGEVWRWSLETGEVLARVDALAGTRLEQITLSPDGGALVVQPNTTYAATDAYPQTLFLDADTLEKRGAVSSHNTHIAPRFGAEGAHAVLFGTRGRIDTWDLRTGELVTHSRHPSFEVEREGSLRMYTHDPATGRSWAVDQERRIWEMTPTRATPANASRASTLDHASLHATHTPDVLLYAADGLLARVDTRDGSDRTVALPADAGRLRVGSPRRDRLVSYKHTRTPGLLDVEPLGHTPLVGHTGETTAATFSRDGEVVFTASHDRTARAWDAASGAPLATLRGHGSWVMDVDATPRTGPPDALVTAGRDGSVRVFHGFDAHARPGPPATPRQAVAAGITEASADVFVSVDDALTTRHAGSNTRRPLGALPFSPSSIDAASGRVVFNHRTHAPFTWTPGGGLTPLPQSPSISSGVRRADLSRDGRVHVAATHKHVHTYDFSKGEWTKHVASVPIYSDVALSADGEHVFVLHYDEHTTLIDRARGDVATLEHTRQEPASVATTSDGSRAVITFWRGGAELWDMRLRERVAVLDGHTDSVWTVRVDPNDRLAATASVDGSVALWDVTTGDPVYTQSHHDAGVTALAFSADGRWLATAARDGYAVVTDTRARGAVVTALHAPETVQQLAWDGDRARFVALSRDGSTRELDPSAPPLDAGAVTNLRVCRGTLEVVPVLPFPAPDTVWAPADACEGEGDAP